MRRAGTWEAEETAREMRNPIAGPMTPGRQAREVASVRSSGANHLERRQEGGITISLC